MQAPKTPLTSDVIPRLLVLLSRNEQNISGEERE